MVVRLQRERLYSIAEWLSWDEHVRAELVDGKPVMMAPPSRVHQEVLGEVCFGLVIRKVILCVFL